MNIAKELGQGIYTSAEVNSKLDSDRARLDVLEDTKLAVCVNATISNSNTAGTTAGAGIAPLYNVYKKGDITVGSDRVTINTEGNYFIYASQLNIVDTHNYFSIVKNGAGQTYGYSSDSSTHVDMHVSKLLYLLPGDYIQLKYSDASKERWSGAHSNFSIHLI
jgi:hypothetical protein